MLTTLKYLLKILAHIFLKKSLTIFLLSFISLISLVIDLPIALDLDLQLFRKF